MPTNSQQIFLSGTAPFLNTPSTEPYVDFTNVDADQSLLPHNLGILIVSDQKHGTLLLSEIKNAENYKADAEFYGISFGGVNSAELGLNLPYYPEFFSFSKEEFPFNLPTPEDHYLKVQFRDNQYKHPDLQGAYRVVLTVEYLEKNPALNHLPEEQQKAIYDAFAASGLDFSYIEIGDDGAINQLESEPIQWITPESVLLKKTMPELEAEAKTE